MARTQEQRKADTRRRLLDAAAAEFARKGFHAVSTETVADAADRTSGAVYAHFGGKDGLLLALLAEFERATVRRMQAALDDAATHEERVAALWDGFVDQAAGADDAWMLLEHELWLYAARRGDPDGALAARYAAGRQAMGEAFARWADDAGTPLPVESDRLGTLVLALLFGLEMQRRVEPAAVPDDLAVDGLRLLFGAPAVARRPPPRGSSSTRTRRARS
ncbi:MAG: helix-turn-helix domain-containing protein [Acidimicrobiales bacterium]